MITAAKLYNLTELNGGNFSVNSLDEANIFCRKISNEHYENFPIASTFIPRKLRKHFYAIYAFARIADDIGDELSKIESKKNTLEALNKYKKSLATIYSNELAEIQNPVFLALRETITEFNIPIQPFLKLISAFESDILFKNFENFDELLAYCENSANPVGELLLRIFGEYNEENLRYSNKICSALQLINFWQDLAVDLARNRCYIPQEILDNSKKQDEIIELLVNFTENLMKSGENLLRNVYNCRLKLELAAIISGGNLLLHKVKSLAGNTFINRPTLSKKDIFALIYRFVKLQRSQ